jgi:hypothetical protein
MDVGKPKIILQNDPRAYHALAVSHLRLYGNRQRAGRRSTMPTHASTGQMSPNVIAFDPAMS